MKTLLAIAVATILLSSVYEVQAQVVGQRVRVTDASDAEIVGLVLEKSQNALTIASKDGSTHEVSYAEMQSLDASIGRRTFRKDGVMFGGGAGALFGLLVSTGLEDRGASIFFALGMGISGALAGLVVGSLITGDRWDAVPIPGRAAAVVEPLVGVRSSGPPVVGVRLTF